MWYEIKSTRLNSVTLSVDSSAHLASAKKNSNYIFTQSEWAQTAAGTLQSTNFNVQGGFFWWCYFHLWFTAPRTDSELKWPTNLHVWHHFCFFFNNKALKKWPLAEVRLVVLCKNNTKQNKNSVSVPSVEARLICSYLSEPSHSSFVLFKQFEGAFALLVVAFTNVGVHAACLPSKILLQLGRIKQNTSTPIL